MHPDPSGESGSTGNGRHRGGSDSMGVCTMEDERNWFVGVDWASMEDERNWFVGVDWASETHHVRVSDARGRKLGARAFAHSGEGLAAMAAWILEVPHGPVVESLMERGFRVHAINPKQLDRFRDRFSPAGAKDDSRDAEVLGDALRTDPHCFRALQPLDPVVVELREGSRMAEDLKQERNRLGNRVRELLWRFYPQILGLTDDVAAPWFLDLWRLIPTSDKAARVREATVDRLLKRYRIRRLSAADVLERLRTPAIPLAPGTVSAAVSHLEAVAKRLDLVNRQMLAVDERLDRLTQSLAGAQEGAEGQRPEPCDVTILGSLPGVGRIVLATLLAEAFEALQRRDDQALRCLSGVAPVTKRSGKSRIVLMRQAAHVRLRNAVYHWARVAVQHDPRSQAKYAALRGHGRALRAVADGLIGVACAMLEAQTI